MTYTQVVYPGVAQKSTLFIGPDTCACIIHLQGYKELKALTCLSPESLIIILINTGKHIL